MVVGWFLNAVYKQTYLLLNPFISYHKIFSDVLIPEYPTRLQGYISV
jgi:hypothetical protein